MAMSIFINLPVENVERARAFYLGLGFVLNEQFSNDQAACVIVEEDILVMLLAKPFFATFTDKPVANAHQSTEVLNCIGCESREQVDQLVQLAQRHGGKAHREAKDVGAMYGHGFEDPDGHIWELVHMSAQQGEA